MDAHHQFTLDADLYARTSDLFHAKRHQLPADAVAQLAREVVARLAAAGLPAQERSTALAAPLPDAGMIRAFCDVLLTPDTTAPLRFLEEELAPIVSDRAALYGYIAAASRELGRMWEEDQISFVEVTLSVGKLYALVRAIGSEGRLRRGARTRRKHALFACVPGEQHTLGVAMAAEVFRNAGWDIDLQLGGTHEELLAYAERLHPAVVGLSLSGESGLDALARLVVALRLILPDLIIAVAGGRDVRAETLQALVDLDLVITDADTAQSDLARLVRLQGGT